MNLESLKKLLDLEKDAVRTCISGHGDNPIGLSNCNLCLPNRLNSRDLISKMGDLNGSDKPNVARHQVEKLSPTRRAG